MAPEGCPVVSYYVDVVEQLSLYRLQDKDVILLELRGLVLALIFCKFLETHFGEHCGELT